MYTANMNFNPRSHEGSDKVSFLKDLMNSNFNPRSHEGSDCKQCSIEVLSQAISIHAPTKGATPKSKPFLLIDAISIHAPTKGATILDSNCDKWINYFNPRSHEGSDTRGVPNFICNSKFQSTLPRRERLPVSYSFLYISRPFQSTLPRRERLPYLSMIGGFIGFQSTLPRRERRFPTK